MQRLIRFPVKGTFYYAATEAYNLELLQEGQLLTLKTEPENSYDRHAIQVWLPSTDEKHGYLLGYVPRVMSRSLNWQLQHQIIHNLAIIHCKRHGQYLEIDCILQLELAIVDFIFLQLSSSWSLQVARFKRMQRRLLSGK